MEALVAAWREARGYAAKNRAGQALRVEMARRGCNAMDWPELMGRI